MPALDMPELTVGIITAGRPRCLEACLASVRAHVTVPHRIIVVDSLDSPENRALCDRQAETTYLGAETTIGPSAARRWVADHLDTPYLLYLDDDIEVQEGCAETLLAYLKEHPGVDVAAGTWLQYGAYRALGQFYRFGHRDGEAVVVRQFATVEEARSLGLTALRVDVALATMMVRREVFDRARFDPRYDFFFELFDFFMQCRAEGVTVHALPDVVFLHNPVPYDRATKRQTGDTEVDRQRFADKWGYQPVGALGFSPGNRPRSLAKRLRRAVRHTFA